MALVEIARQEVNLCGIRHLSRGIGIGILHINSVTGCRHPHHTQRGVGNHITVVLLELRSGNHLRKGIFRHTFAKDFERANHRFAGFVVARECHEIVGRIHHQHIRRLFQIGEIHFHLGTQRLGKGFSHLHFGVVGIPEGTANGVHLHRFGLHEEIIHGVGLLRTVIVGSHKSVEHRCPGNDGVGDGRHTVGDDFDIGFAHEHTAHIFKAFARHLLHLRSV